MSNFKTSKLKIASIIIQPINSINLILDLRIKSFTYYKLMRNHEKFFSNCGVSEFPLFDHKY